MPRWVRYPEPWFWDLWALWQGLSSVTRQDLRSRARGDCDDLDRHPDRGARRAKAMLSNSQRPQPSICQSRQGLPESRLQRRSRRRCSDLNKAAALETKIRSGHLTRRANHWHRAIVEEI